VRSLHVGAQVGISRCEFPPPTRWNYHGRMRFFSYVGRGLLLALVVVLIPTGAWATEMTRSGEVRLAALAHIQLITPVPAGLLATGACAKVPPGRRSTMRSGTSTRRSARDRNWPLRAATRADSEIFIAGLLFHPRNRSLSSVVGPCFGQPLSDLVDTRDVARMSGQKFGWLVAADFGHPFPKSDCGCRIIAGFRH